MNFRSAICTASVIGGLFKHNVVERSCLQRRPHVVQNEFAAAKYKWTWHTDARAKVRQKHALKEIALQKVNKYNCNISEILVYFLKWAPSSLRTGCKRSSIDRSIAAFVGHYAISSQIRCDEINRYQLELWQSAFYRLGDYSSRMSGQTEIWLNANSQCDLWTKPSGYFESSPTQTGFCQKVWSKFFHWSNVKNSVSKLDALGPKSKLIFLIVL